MGAWGLKPFENDDALDFLDELEQDGPTWAEVQHEFQEVIKTTDYLEAPEGSQAVAGAALVAAKLDAGYALPVGYDALLLKMGDLPKGIVAAAEKALLRVRGEKSELKDLWEEGDGVSDWLETLSQIQKILTAHSSDNLI